MKNYIVAHFTYDDNHKFKNMLSCYTFGCQVQYGNEDDAERFLKYVKEQRPDEDWQIFWLNNDRDNLKTPESVRREVEEKGEYMERLRVKKYKAWCDLKNAS